ncbi:esterase/lipase family protein [Alloalcanivorax xenomutans]|uniref:Triacylglycerol lipase n=1 Tax=Alloalcanivorax xenomutans TaxID=1094342 RepID=A0A9Q3ZHD4_9GAMM|nr:triacylglycerol lipase [Alloalcanivorax xenomutans]ARB44065.1 lipase [Alloalcanivorax xenomutans]MCE7510764.1 triacylglycerol lipase [Alloalcanivorax xenomutans]MCE7522930.1 triacylglycerol lipase [Alloalcanivorax xenomutans]WOD28542.1 triacylglycerol lipase [Alloalcanivorax xenomutans]
MSWIFCLLLVLMLIPGALTLVFYLLWYYDRRAFPSPTPADRETALRPLPALLAVAREAISLTVLVLSYPLRLVQDASPQRSRQQGQKPIILVHGYGGNSTNFLWLQWWLRRRGWANVYSVSYTPPHINARKLAQQVADHVNRILVLTGAEKADLVCHSMGGPLARYALKNLGLAGKVDRVITLGSPHRGSRISALFAPRGAAAQMRYDSPFIKELEEGGACPGGARYQVIYSTMDNFILPASSALLDGAERSVHVPYLGHCALLYSRRVARAVAEGLQDESLG